MVRLQPLLLADDTHSSYRTQCRTFYSRRMLCNLAIHSTLQFEVQSPSRPIMHAKVHGVHPVITVA